MRKRVSSTRCHIIDVAVVLLAEGEGDEIHVVDIAREADVGIQSIYYHFGSLSRLIAEAQLSTYLRFSEPLHALLLATELAVIENDEPKFWQSIGDDVRLAWSYGYGGDARKTSRLLIDINSDAMTHRDFTELLDIEFERWIKVIDAGKLLGWVYSDLDTSALIASCWGGLNGQSIFSGTSIVHYTPETIRDFWLEIAMAKRGGVCRD